MTTTAPTRPSGRQRHCLPGSAGTSAHAADIARGVASTTLASFVDSLVDVGQGAICAEHRFDRLPARRADVDQGSQQRFCAGPRTSVRGAGVGNRLARRRPPRAGGLAGRLHPPRQTKVSVDHGEPRSENVFAGIQRGGLDKSVRAALRTRGPVDDSASPERVDGTTPPASGSHSLRSGPPSADCPMDRRPEVPGAELVEAGAEPSLR